jgi:hypothetical protein
MTQSEIGSGRFEHLRQKIEALLRASDRVGDFLQERSFDSLRDLRRNSLRFGIHLFAPFWSSQIFQHHLFTFSRRGVIRNMTATRTKF